MTMIALSIYDDASMAVQLRVCPSLASTFRELLIMGHYRLAEVSIVSYSLPLSGHYRYVRTCSEHS